MRFALLICEGPFQHQAADSAWHFARAVLDRGHQLHRVFFYHDGVYNANRLAAPPADERPVQRRWSELAQRHGVDLVVCVAAAQRRGMLDEAEMQRQRRDAHVLAAGFRISGLGQLVEAAIDADRLVVFGD